MWNKEDSELYTQYEEEEDRRTEQTTVKGKTIEVKYVHEKAKCKILVIMCDTFACQDALIKGSSWSFIGPYLIQQSSYYKEKFSYALLDFDESKGISLGE